MDTETTALAAAVAMATVVIALRKRSCKLASLFVFSLRQLTSLQLPLPHLTLLQRILFNADKIRGAV
jgi:hypothetical protein